MLSLHVKGWIVLAHAKGWVVIAHVSGWVVLPNAKGRVVLRTTLSLTWDDNPPPPPIFHGVNVTTTDISLYYFGHPNEQLAELKC